MKGATGATMKRPARYFTVLSLLVLGLAAGCGTEQKKDQNFFTSGSNAADQRADQRMAKAEQIKGDGEGAGEKHGDDKTAHVPEKKPLYERLGGDQGIQAIVDDFVPRVLADPRVNWDRSGVIRGGFSFHHYDSMQWDANAQNVAQLKAHLAQFLALATGGPAVYQGREMKEAHASLHISNPEFDATIGDLKASLDKYQIANQEQKELLSIVESTRPLIVEER